MKTHWNQSSRTSSRPRLHSLAGVRIIAALHIYFFHLKQANDAGVLTFPLLGSLGAPAANLLGRGYVSTGFFFQLSGFLLAYAYLDASGRLKTTPREFWKGRLLRLYPLYAISLLLLIPAPALLPFTAKHPSALETLAGMATSLTLTQAWFPSLALWWNAPAWALSAFAAFYVATPLFAQVTSGLDRRGLVVVLMLLVALSWLPAGLYLLIDPYGDARSVTSITLGGPWLNALRFDPLTWLPQFLSGLVLGRLFTLRADTGEAPTRPTGRLAPSLGDAVALAIVGYLSLAPSVSYVALRHGLLAPMLLVVIADLASGRGLLARILARPAFGRLSEASFSLFALQMPAGVWFCIAFLSSSRGTTAQLLGMIAWTLGVSVAWAELIQRPFIDRLRRREQAARALGLVPQVLTASSGTSPASRVSEAETSRVAGDPV
ncbi:acyltransferase family protein [Singulisphaera sp. PoT]|uniref:acyltransferase family protein n=1 Tax=Singulisphaera sp. PoT TaxID=3411797 RepID=UPI003BF619B1